MTALNTIDRHHLVPRKRLKNGGKNKHPRYRRIRLKRFRHLAWHTLFGHKTIDEVIELLERVRRAKRR